MGVGPEGGRSGQQEETFRFFDSYSRSWRDEANSSGYSAIVNRRVVLRTVAGDGDTQLDVLDVGCGSGELCVELAMEGHRCVGLDFSPEMIELARELASRSSVDIDFVCRSFFDHPVQPETFDLVAALGFIEYISAAELDEFIERCRGLLRRGGRVAVGSRNRLFNMVSLNAYTELELSLDTVSELTSEAVLCASAESQVDLVQRLRSSIMPLPEADRHPILDPDRQIRVQTRHQYTPSEMLTRLERAGFAVEMFAPINVHATHPIALRVDERTRAAYETIGQMAQRDHLLSPRLIPISSSFIVVAKKV